MLKLIVSGIFVLAIVGCDSTQVEPDTLSIQTDKDLYAVGERVNITVENETDVEFRMVTACSYALQLEAGTRWKTIGTVACPENARVGTITIEPGEIYSTEVDIPKVNLEGIGPSRTFRLNFVAFRNRHGDVGENGSSSNGFGLYGPR